MESVVMGGMCMHCSEVLAGWNVDDWLREPVWEPTIQTQTVFSNRVFGARKRGFRCLLHQANAPVCVCGLMQRNTQTKSTPQQTISAWTERRSGTDRVWKDAPFRAAMTPTVESHERDVSESLAVVQLRALVAMVGKTGIDRCWGRNDVYDGGGICDACGTELQEQCVQDDVRLASYVAELARTVGTAGEGEECEACDVEAGPSLDHGDDVEQLMGHQAVTNVTKILDTDEGTLTESLKEYFSLREKAVQALVELCSGIESDVLVASRHATYPRERRRTDG